MSLTYRKVDALLAPDTGGEVREGDTLLLEVGGAPREGELVLVKRGRAEAVCRWRSGCGEVVGVVVGVKRRL